MSQGSILELLKKHKEKEFTCPEMSIILKLSPIGVRSSLKSLRKKDFLLYRYIKNPKTGKEVRVYRYKD